MTWQRHFPRALAALALATLVCLIPGCVNEHGVGNPAKSKVDKKLVGYWYANMGKQSQLLSVTAFDERAYVVELIQFKGEFADPTVTQRTTFKAWLTKIKGQTFLTMRGLQPKNFFSKTHLVGKIVGKRDKLTFTGISTKFADFKECTSRKELEAALAENVDNDSAFGNDMEYSRKSFEKDDLKKFYGKR